MAPSPGDPGSVAARGLDGETVEQDSGALCFYGINSQRISVRVVSLLPVHGPLRFGDHETVAFG